MQTSICRRSRSPNSNYSRITDTRVRVLGRVPSILAGDNYVKTNVLIEPLRNKITFLFVPMARKHLPFLTRLL